MTDLHTFYVVNFTLLAHELKNWLCILLALKFALHVANNFLGLKKINGRFIAIYHTLRR